uniref:ADP-ribosylglycohydrolase n=1 Tax=Panagrolaimus sp. ES5 TaxID=591445 RepID=A0AC34G2A5_9BILA
MDEKDRIYGAFFGQVIGDALGVYFEFGTADTAKKEMVVKKRERQNSTFFGFVKTGPEPILPMLGVDSNSIGAGQFTDDTEMALSLARSIVAKGEYNKIDVACAYSYWFCCTNPKTAGVTTKKALRCKILTRADKKVTPNWRNELTDAEKTKIFEEINKNVSKQNTQSLSNGSLMRISPLAVAFRNLNIKKLRALAKDDASITHCHPIALDAAATYVVALAALLKGANNKSAFEEAFNSAETEMVKIFLENAKIHAIPVKLYQEDPTLPVAMTNGDDRFMGYLGVALQSAFYELLHAESFVSGLERTISRGGDTDTNGCIVAAMLGARFGYNSIPKEWIESVKAAPPCLYSIGKIRETIDMDFLSIKDADYLIDKLTNIYRSS